MNDKVVLITGSTQGIGAAIASAWVEAGAKVMVHGRDEARAKALCEQLGSEHAAYCIKNLTDLDAPQYLVEQTLEKYGRIDVLVNNAGIFPRNTIDDLDDEFYDRVTTVNMRFPLFLTKKVVEVFRKQPEKGTIVNIGSINAYTGQTDLLVYSMSKGALMTMTRNLGDALGTEGIRINQLNVGWTLTETEKALKKSEGLPENWESNLPDIFRPSGKLLRPEDIARHVVFWGSNDSRPVTGQVYELEQYPILGRNLINAVVRSDTV